MEQICRNLFHSSCQHPKNLSPIFREGPCDQREGYSVPTWRICPRLPSISSPSTSCFVAPIYLQCHTSTSEVFTFRSSSSPAMPQAEERWIFTQNNTRDSFKNLDHFLWTHNNVPWNKGCLVQRKSILQCVQQCVRAVIPGHKQQ